MTILTDHVVTAADELIRIERVARSDGEPGPEEWDRPYYLITVERLNDHKHIPLHFQKGPVVGNGVNGITNEALLAVVLDRLRGFQESPHRCRENAVAITKLEESLMWLQKRTRDRQQRGVEGTNGK